MPGKVKLEVVEGSMLGKHYVFDQHDTFLFGRMSDCHACLPGDPAVSRHHFIMEVNPPDARIRDLGSRNGIYINGIKYGGRKEGETPEEGAKREYHEVNLKNGDRIVVGTTVLAVELEVPAICCECGRAIADGDREKCAWLGGTFICVSCKDKAVASKEAPKGPKATRCQKCGKDVSGEVGKARCGDYVCESCRQKLKADPAEILRGLLGEAEKRSGIQGEPTIAGYDIEKRLGTGGFGVVYLARCKRGGELVAIKVMLSKVAVGKHGRERFLQEINLLKAIEHKNIVSLKDHGAIGSVFYFVMEYCESGSVDHLMKHVGGTLGMAEAASIMLQALDGLAYAHSKGVVHRDIKPGNILLKGSKKNWLVKISDLGLAKNFEQAGFSGMTMTGSTMGTPSFMPREQVTNFKHVKPVSDVWGIGATFYNMITGRVPRDFRAGRDPMEVVLHGAVVPIRKRDPSIPKGLAEVIDRALSDETTGRYQSAGEMRKALERVL